MRLLSTERRYGTWTVSSRSTLTSPPVVSYRRKAASSWTTVTADWSGAEQVTGAVHTRSAAVLFAGSDASGGGAQTLTPGTYETMITYTDDVEIIAGQTDDIEVTQV